MDFIFCTSAVRTEALRLCVLETPSLNASEPFLSCLDLEEGAWIPTLSYSRPQRTWKVFCIYLRRFFYAVSLPLLILAIVSALRVMPAKGTSWLVHLDVGLAWFAALSTLVLVPTDVSTTLEVRRNKWSVARVGSEALDWSYRLSIEPPKVVFCDFK